MSGCDAIREKAPAVVRGEAGWDPAEREHLESCGECRREVTLIRSAVRLGRMTPPIDPARVAEGLQRRLGRQSRVPRRWMVGGALAAAAALALILVPAPSTGPEAGMDLAPAQAIFLPELDSLSADELHSVLGSVEGPLGSTETLGGAGLGDLSTDELTAVLRSMEG